MAQRYNFARQRIDGLSRESMLSVLEAIVFVILVLVSLAGFAAAIAGTFAVWFGNRG